LQPLRLPALDRNRLAMRAPFPVGTGVMDNRLRLRGRSARLLAQSPVGGCGPLCLSETSPQPGSPGDGHTRHPRHSDAGGISPGAPRLS
jgi:hypothetical protein